MNEIKTKELQKEEKKAELGVGEEVKLNTDKQTKVDERYAQLQKMLSQMEQLDKEMDELDLNYVEEF